MWVVWAVLLVCVAVAVSTGVGLVTVARHRAAAAADLAALAAAGRLVAGWVDGCAVAGEVASAGGAAMTRCALDGEIVTVEVTVGLPGALRPLGPARAVARAGPG